MALGSLLALSLSISFAQVPSVAAQPEEAARDAFKKGVTLFQQKQFDGASEALVQVPELGGYLSLYKHYYLGQAYLELNKFKEAEPELAKVIQSQGSGDMKYSAQFFYGELALRQKNYAEAIKRLTPLEKKWKRSYRYPEVLYRLMVAELRQNHNASACKRAVTLYSKYPAHVSVIGWNSDLAQVQIDGRPLPCRQSRNDFQQRIRNLQWSGESDKANREIVDLLSKAPEGEVKRDLDLLLANFMVNEGNVVDALNLLIRYYPQLKSNIEYLALLGKAAARSGEYQTAVGAYERAYEIAPKAKKGREALYQAAYLSYQFQDYDGAVRKFQQFQKANPKSGLAKDAAWHLAWLQYLRNDFKGALEKFDVALKSAKSRRGKNDSLQERLLYWMAMSHTRLNQLDQARQNFEQIVAKNPYSYYGLAAQARLDGVVAKLAENSKRLPATKADAKDASAAGTAAVAAKVPPAAEVAAVAAGSEEKESEEEIADDAEAPAAAAAGEGPDEEGLSVTTFKDPAQRARIDVALKLIQLGLPELAKWELWEVEKHTRNPQYLRMLISAYEGINSFNRSATIADLYFGKDRDQGGFDGARALWQSAYPQAYKKTVEQYSKEQNLAPEWAWAIMRTESMYKPDVISPVGAKGLMQLMNYTARNLTKLRGEVTDNIDLLSPDQNIRLGTQYLARLGTKFKGQLPLVAAAYNAGPHRVEGWLVNFGHLETDEFVEHIPFLETRNYVKKVVRSHTFYRRLYQKDARSVDFLAKALGVPIPSRAATRETWESL